MSSGKATTTIIGGSSMGDVQFRVRVRDVDVAATILGGTPILGIEITYEDDGGNEIAPLVEHIIEITSFKTLPAYKSYKLIREDYSGSLEEVRPAKIIDLDNTGVTWADDLAGVYYIVGFN